MQEQLNVEILRKLQLIENLLREKQTDLLNLNQTAQYLSISHSHLYKMTSQRKIPFHKPSGKYLYFFKHELDAWITRNEECRLSNEDQKSEDRNHESLDNQPGLFDEEDTEPP